jgi:PAS domain S-box-containing protein
MAKNGTSGPDLLNHKQTKEQTERSEELYRNMIELSPDIILTLDIKGTVTSCNAVAVKTLGYSKDEMVGRHFSKMGAVRLKDVPRYMKIFGAVLGGKVTEPIELTFKRKDGALRLADIRVNLLKVGGKTIILATLRDVTERRQMEQEIQTKNKQLDAQNEELRSANEELQAAEEELRASNEELREAQEQLVRSEKLAAIGQLAGGVGHELRNPLGAIKNAIYYVKGKVANSELAQKEPRVIEFLNIMDDEVNSSNKIISDLLGFSRTNKPDVSPTRIEQVIETALSQTPVPEHIEINRHLDTSLPEIKIDPDQIKQVIINIITNAVQAMPDGGRLTIDTAKKGNFLEIEITDTGSGIPDEVASKIFDPLFTTKAKGIGLGLAVCKSIIDRHEGDIGVKSKAGRGTTFNIKLPLKVA